MLKNKGIRRTFFTGDFYRNRANKKLIEHLRKDGHYLGAHSDKHLLYATWETAIRCSLINRCLLTI
ncbi:MAG: hypothetical protein R3C26_13910 [Calditrichia bacterium]